MLKLSHRINTLKQRVEDENLGKRTAVWKEPSNNLEDLAKKTCETCAVYQIRMSSSYIHEHLNRNFQFFVHQEDECLIRVTMQSRPVASKVYLLRIEYDASAVTAWYCKCKSGARVVGVCAHIASILWYLEYARHNSDIRFGVKNCLICYINIDVKYNVKGIQYMIATSCEIKNSIFNRIHRDRSSSIYILERYKCWWYKNDNMRDAILILAHLISRWTTSYDLFDASLIGKLFRKHCCYIIPLLIITNKNALKVRI